MILLSVHGRIRSVLALHAHLVFVTKFRHPVFTGAHLERMEQIMREICADFECELTEFNGESNHVHPDRPGRSGFPCPVKRDGPLHPRPEGRERCG
ncbi:transposase [Nonomuraea wenchangensis]